MDTETLKVDLDETNDGENLTRVRCASTYDGRRCLLTWPHDDRRHAAGELTWSDGEEPPPEPDPVESYVDMFREYLADQDWIGAADRPFVFHVRKICQQLDQAGSDAKPALASSYLQALSRLDRRRPAPASGYGGTEPVDPAQRSIYDELD